MASKPSPDAILDTLGPYYDKLEAALLFNEGTGTAVSDYTGNGHDVTLDLTALSWGVSTLFTDSSAVVSVATAGTTRGSVAGFTGFQPSYTVEVWFTYQTGDSYAALVNSDGGGFDAGIFIHNGKVDLYRAGDHDGTASLVAGSSYQVVVTSDGTDVKYYINGVLDKTTTLDIGNLFKIQSVCNDLATETFVGTYDLLFVWDDRCLTGPEVEDRYANPFNLFEAEATGFSGVLPVGFFALMLAWSGEVLTVLGGGSKIPLTRRRR